MNSNGSSITIKKDSKWNFRKNWRSYMFVLAILAYPLGLTIFFFSTINILSIIMSFQSYDYFGNATFVGFKNYAEVIKTAFEGGELFDISLANSLLMYIIPLFIMLPLYIFFSYYIFAEFVHKLLFCSSPVTPRCNKNGNISIGVTFSDFTKHCRHNNLAGNRAGMVTCNYDNLFLTL